MNCHWWKVIWIRLVPHSGLDCEDVGTGTFESVASVFKSLETVGVSKSEERSGKTGNFFHKHKHATAHPEGFPVR